MSAAREVDRDLDPPADALWSLVTHVGLRDGTITARPNVPGVRKFTCRLKDTHKLVIFWNAPYMFIISLYYDADDAHKLCFQRILKYPDPARLVEKFTRVIDKVRSIVDASGETRCTINDIII